MKKRLALLLILFLILVPRLAAPASAEEAPSEAMQLHLERGSVVVCDASGSELAFTQDMDVYSGYRIATGEDSCAVIVLDGAKTVKLDENSSVTLTRSGSEFRIDLSEGQLVFLVTVPLEEDETLEICSDFIGTSVRGSSGIVTLRKVIYGTGHGMVYRPDELGALPMPFELRGGQQLDLSGDDGTAQVTPAQVSDFPSVYLKEVEQNESLQQALEAEGNYSADEMIAEIPAAEAREQQERDIGAATVAPTAPTAPEEGEASVRFTVTFVYRNESGMLVQDAGSYASGTKAADVRIPNVPSTCQSEQTFFRFLGWDPAVHDVTGDATYTAGYYSEPREYNVTWVLEDGTVLDRTPVAYGETPGYVAPVKEPDESWVYEFSGWTPALVPVTGDATYTAVFSMSPRPADVTLTVFVPEGACAEIRLDTQEDGLFAGDPYEFTAASPDATLTVPAGTWARVTGTVTDDNAYVLYPEPVAVDDELFGNDHVFQVLENTEIAILCEPLAYAPES